MTNKLGGNAGLSMEDTKAVLTKDQVDINQIRFPDLSDLMERLRFSTKDGRIILDDQRMLLINAHALGSMRHEIIETFGIEIARGLFTRMGYEAGVHDAKLSRKVRSESSAEDMFSVGPQMHCLVGIGLSEPIQLEVDVDKDKHYGEFVWSHPVEDEEHLRYYPIGEEPTCWMQIGYASGYSTEFMGRYILYREVECQSLGQTYCRIIGKPVEEWGEDGARDFSFCLPLEKDEPRNISASKFNSNLIAIDATPGEDDTPVGISPGFQSVMHMVRNAAPTNATVLFLGESGVGKEVFAKELHKRSARVDQPFVAVNCAAMPEQLIESELFGYVRGAFTGATQNRIGRFERADGGTLFLDEIGTLSFGAQGNLLRVLQEGEIERLGDSQSRKVDVRLIAATNVDLREEVRAGRFREDLYFRLNVFPIQVPPLRERRDDIPLLVGHFLHRFNRVHGRSLAKFTQRAIDAILTYEWPGNVRELENVIERGVILAGDASAIDASHLFTSGELFKENYYRINPEGQYEQWNPTPVLETAAAQDPDDEYERTAQSITKLLKGLHDDKDRVSFDEIETVLLKKALETSDGNIAAAARVLGMTRPQMVYRLKSRGILDKPK
ncbi:MAG: sigma 54-interacting transcriptional regulator [Magnetospiraceae bacterium]